MQSTLALARPGKTQRRVFSAATGTVFVQDSADAARTQWRSVADRLRGKFPEQGMLMDGAESAMQGECEECLAARMDDFVTEPIRVDALVQALLSVPAQPQ